MNPDGAIGPLCPICPADKPHNVEPNTGRAGGWLCNNCGFVFDGGHREAQHPRTQRRRDMWAEETRPRNPPAPTTTTQEDRQPVTRPTSDRAEGGTQ